MIVKIGDETIDDQGDIAGAVHDHDPGDKVDVVVMRDRKKKSLSATLSEKEVSTFDVEPGNIGYLVHDALENVPDIHVDMDKVRDGLQRVKAHMHGGGAY